MPNRRFSACFVVFAMVVALLIAGCTNPVTSDPPGSREDRPGDPLDQPPDPPAGDPDPSDPETDEVFLIVTEINFSDETPGVVAAEFNGSGLSHPPDIGQLNAEAWQITGFSDGDQMFGQVETTGDLARGASGGGVSTGGVYAFVVEPENVALGVQPTASDFQPGSIALKLAAPDARLESVEIAYSIWHFNDQDRSTVWRLEWSADGSVWMDTGTDPLASPATSDPDPQWISVRQSMTLARSEIIALEWLYLRWIAVDGDGTGARDECALDDIMIAFTCIAP